MASVLRQFAASLALQKLNDFDPEAYLRFVLARIADHAINRVD